MTACASSGGGNDDKRAEKTDDNPFGVQDTAPLAVVIFNGGYGEDYAIGLRISRQYRIGRIYDSLYLCRRWEGNSDANLSIERVNANNTSHQWFVHTFTIKHTWRLVFN